MKKGLKKKDKRKNKRVNRFEREYDTYAHKTNWKYTFLKEGRQRSSKEKNKRKSIFFTLFTRKICIVFQIPKRFKKKTSRFFFFRISYVFVEYNAIRGKFLFEIFTLTLHFIMFVDCSQKKTKIHISLHPSQENVNFVFRLLKEGGKY